MSDCTVEVLSWEDGAWQTVAEGGVSISAAGTRRLGVVLSGDKITVNVQDGGTQYSYAPRLDGMDRGLETGRASVWLEEDQAMTIGERTPLYLEIYDDGEGVGIPPARRVLRLDQSQPVRSGIRRGCHPGRINRAGFAVTENRREEIIDA